MTQEQNQQPKTYIILSEAWYNYAILRTLLFVEEVLITLHTDTVCGEFAVRWYALPGVSEPCPRLEAFDDSWAALAQSGIVDVLARLDSHRPTVFAVCIMLKSLGFVDVTPRKREG